MEKNNLFIQKFQHGKNTVFLRYVIGEKIWFAATDILQLCRNQELINNYQVRSFIYRTVTRQHFINLLCTNYGQILVTQETNRNTKIYINYYGIVDICYYLQDYSLCTFFRSVVGIQMLPNIIAKGKNKLKNTKFILTGLLIFFFYFI